MNNERKARKSAYDQKYMKENITRKLLAFNRNNPEDVEILTWLNAQKNATEYIKKLILNDMKRSV